MSVAARIAVALSICLLLPAAADARWTRLRSANFEFIGDATGARIRQVAERLEQFREVLARALPGATAVSPVPTIVMVFADDRALTPVKPLFRGGTIDVGGYLESSEDLNYIALNGEYIDIALRTVYHEYAHVLVSNSIGSVPVWVNEGLAEFYEITQGLEGGKTIVIGRAPGEHVELLKGSTLMPIKQLLAINRNSPVYNEGSRRGVFYAQSWALVHYLTLGNKERSTQFSRYLSALKAGTDFDRAFSDTFGADTTELDRELFQYIRQFAFPALSFRLPEKIVGQADRPISMDDIEGEIHVSDLQARIGREDEARARLKAVLARKPDAARASAVLALIDYRARRFKEALPLLERAAEQDPRDAFVQTSFGRAVIAALNDQNTPDARTVAFQKARTALSRAVEVNPTSAYAAGLLGYVELADGSDLTRAIAMLERAARLAPSREQYRLLLAQALIQQGEYQRAINYLGLLLANGSTADVRSDARRLLGEAANRKTVADAPASSTAPDRSNNTVALTAVADLFLPTNEARVRLDLRPVNDGETRVLGLFQAIECQPDSIVLRIDAEGRVLRLRAKQLSDIDFITYRQEPPGSVNCGALPSPARVLATYRPGALGTGAATTDGDAVAIELLPDGYKPPR